MIRSLNASLISLLFASFSAHGYIFSLVLFFFLYSKYAKVLTRPSKTGIRIAIIRVLPLASGSSK